MKLFGRLAVAVTVAAALHNGRVNDLDARSPAALGGPMQSLFSGVGGCGDQPAAAVYVASNDGKLHAVHAASGKAKWTKEIGLHEHREVSPTPVPSADGSTIYVGAYGKKVYALRAKDGEETWTHTAGSAATKGAWSPKMTLSVDGATVYLGFGDEKLHALRAKSGEHTWSYQPPVPIRSGAAISRDGATLYFGKMGSNPSEVAQDTGLHAVKVAEGGAQWTAQRPVVSPDAHCDICANPVVSPDDSTVYVGCATGMVHAVQADGGDLKWTYDADGPINQNGSPITSPDGRTLYVVAGNKLIAIATDSGEPKWTYETVQNINASPSISPDGATIYVGSCSDKTLHAVQADNGQAKWKHTTSGRIETSPAVSADGSTVFVASETRGRDPALNVETYVHGYLEAVRAENAKAMWTYESEVGFSSSPAVSPE